MRELLLNLAGREPELHRRHGLVRECLQALILESLQRSGAFIPMAFQGGTALRFLHGMRRFSEDLDFALEFPDRGHYDLSAYLRRIRSDLAAQGFDVGIKLDVRRPVHKAFVRLPGFLHEVRISPHRGAVLAVKIEVDTRPPAGAGLETTVVRQHVMLHLQHHDRASLLAGKLHAVLARPATKGRDLYDLAWYLADRTWPAPNLVMLNAALCQTSWAGEALRADTWREVVWRRLESIDLPHALADVRPFLEDPGELESLSLAAMRKLLVS